MAAADYYAILELPRSPAPTPDEVQAAYRRIARLVHPDRNPSPDANAQFQAVQKAYECLKDPEARKLYDQFGAAEAEQYEQTYSAVAKTRIGKILLSDWRWVAAVFGWLLMGYLNRNWLYTPLHWVVPAVAAPFFGPGSFLQQILQGLHWKRPAVVAHASMVGLSALLGLILPVSWITAMSRLTLLIFCLGLGVSIKDDRDIPLTLFVASFFSDIYGKVNNNLINRIIGSHALLSFTIALLPLWLVLGEGGRYPRRSYLTPALVTLVTRVLLPLAAFILLCFPGWIQTILAMLAPCLALDWLFPMPTEWFGFIVLRILFELVDVSLRRVAIKTPLGVAISAAWYYLVPTRYSPAALNAVIYSYLIRQACAFDDRPNAFGRLPRHLRFGTVSWWLVLLAMDALLRNVSTAYPRYAAITAAFAIIATFDVRMPGPRRPRPPQQEAEEEAPSPHTDAPPRARPGPSGRRRRGG